MLDGMSGDGPGHVNNILTSGKGKPDVETRAAWHRISLEPGYLRCELFNRRTIEETRKFLEAAAAEALKHRCPQVLVCVRSSKPIFTVERFGFSHYLELVFESSYKIALVADTPELRIAHQYIATLARIRGVNLRAFPEEGAAISWLTSGEGARSAEHR